MSKNSEYVWNFKKRVKESLVMAFGNHCCICHQQYIVSIYEFHHINPELKQFNLSDQSTHKIAAYSEEAQKCVMVCANCHRIVERAGYDFVLKSNFDKDIFTETFEELKVDKSKFDSILRNANLVVLDGKTTKMVPTRDQLKYLLQTFSLGKISSMYDVEISTILRWATKFKLPHTFNDISSFPIEQWEML